MIITLPGKLWNLAHSLSKVSNPAEASNFMAGILTTKTTFRQSAI